MPHLEERSTERLGRLVRRHRRLLSAGLAGMAVFLLASAFVPEPPPVNAIVVAAADLPAGHRLQADDLSVARVAAALIPSGSTAQIEDLVGQVTAGRIGGGEVVATARLVSEQRALPGQAILPVRFADAGAAGLLSPGQRITLISADDPSGAGASLNGTIVAGAALVLSVREPESEWSGPDSEGALVVLEVSAEEALRLAGLHNESRLSFLFDTG